MSNFSNGIALVQSRTFWAATLALAAIVAQAFGLSSVLKWAADPATVDTILSIAGALGAVGAIVFRAAATQTITSVTTSK